MVELADLGAPGKYLRRPAHDNLAALLKGAKNDRVNLKILSAWRSYFYQKSLFSFFSRKYKNAASFSAEAGHSEHQLGTTIDFGAGDSKTDLNINFAQTPPGKWLEQNAFKYGFVMSYPAGKEAITGYIYEPWHYRYIGVEAAREFYNSGLTLQEFLTQKPQHYQEELPLE
ncbi:MAG: peptidase M15B and M15C DD-carboxypeptidase VanY/endolysin [Parcubacteria group bacterium LiPW_39]|nr:MAG: peptidase M15B and M15C DD-carboxypeptidase VanY/endolysin [Parcubacteria group bacterium LiPW_39]